MRLLVVCVFLSVSPPAGRFRWASGTKFGFDPNIHRGLLAVCRRLCRCPCRAGIGSLNLDARLDVHSFRHRESERDGCISSRGQFHYP